MLLCNVCVPVHVCDGGTREGHEKLSQMPESSLNTLTIRSVQHLDQPITLPGVVTAKSIM